MDESYEDTKEFLNKVPYRTLIIIPIKDEIVPRKPLTKLLIDKKVVFFDIFKMIIFLYINSQELCH